MKPILLSLSFLLLVFFSATAQKQKVLDNLNKDQTKGWVGFSAGPSFPIGAIANTNPSDSTSGFAKTGAHLNLNIGYQISGPVGICVILHSTANPINADAYSKALSQALPSGINGSFEIKPWQMSGILAGPYFKLPSYGASSFHLRALVGYANVRNPETKIILSKYGYQSLVATKESNEFMAFSYSLGGAANVKLNKFIQIMLNFDFLTATPTIKDLKTTFSNGAPYYISTAYDQPYSVINITLGIAYIVQ